MGSTQEYLSSLGRFLLFLPFFFGLFILGSLKGMIVCPAALVILTVGDAAVILGLFVAHVTWLYYSLARTKRLGRVLKTALLLILPVPILLWPFIGIFGSVLVGLGYGFFTPLVATFEAVREGRRNKFIHCFTDGVWDTIKGSCTVVRDFTDFCYHSYFSYLQDFRKETSQDYQPYEIKLMELPVCVLVGLLGVIIDVPFITLVAFAKSPYMLIRGWRRLLQDLIGREGPFLETVCVPFAGLAILLWPLVVTTAVVCALLSSILIGLYGAVIVYQENSFQSGLAYIVAVVAQFDEYTNDMIYMPEGSCFPRPKYRKQRATQSGSLSTRPSMTRQMTGENLKPDINSPSPTPRSGSFTSRTSGDVGSLSIKPSRSLRQALQEVKMVQIWDNIFKTCELYGKELVQADVIKLVDLEEWSRSSKSVRSRMIGVGLPAYALLQNLIDSAKAGVGGLLLYDGVELNMFNRPQDRLLDWFFEPILILKEQIQAATLKESEELYFGKWVLTSGDTDKIEAWHNGGVPPDDELRKGELQAWGRRIQGITTSVTRLPTFRRRYQCTIKTLITVAQDTEASGRGSLRTGKDSTVSGNQLSEESIRSRWKSGKSASPIMKTIPSLENIAWKAPFFLEGEDTV